MCFSPKMKVPQVDTNQVKAVEPAPLTETPSGVIFGDDEKTSSEVATGSSRKDSKVELDTSKTKESTKTGSGVKKSISKKAFN